MCSRAITVTDRHRPMEVSVWSELVLLCSSLVFMQRFVKNSIRLKFGDSLWQWFRNDRYPTFLIIISLSMVSRVCKVSESNW